jgi:isopenicillin N synthase-like dioxygenase
LKRNLNLHLSIQYLFKFVIYKHIKNKKDYTSYCFQPSFLLTKIGNTMKKQRAIPVVDLSKFTNGTPRQKSAFVKKLGQAFHEVGFVGVINHGIPKSLVDDFYKEAKSFFALPVETKEKYEIPALAGQRGYTSFGKEHAKHSKVADLKEFFQIGQEVSASDPYKSEYPDNVKVAEKPQFAKLGMELYRSFEKSGGALLRAIAIHLDLGENYFEERIQKGNSILRAIHYPPISQEPKSAIRAEQHEDINLITLLVGASAGGLQLLTKENEWKDIVPEEDEIVINVGDMLQRLTNNYLKSTTHRVVNPPRSEWHLPRLSIPFFLHPISKMDLTCLPKTITPERPLAYKPITAGAYLDERLREIGLKK